MVYSYHAQVRKNNRISVTVSLPKLQRKTANMHRVLALLALGWLAGLARQDSGANQATPSYEDLLEAVKSGKFEVASKPQLPDPKSELEDILFKSKDY